MEAVKTRPPRKVFEVIIQNNLYYVYDIDGREHEGHGDVPKTWWLYFSEELPENLIPPADSEYFIPYHSWIKRLLWEIRIKENNTSKYKWDEWSFSNSAVCEMWCNNRKVYEFFTGDGDFAMSKAQTLKIILIEHSYRVFDSKEVYPGAERKIYYHGLPAIATTCNDIWEVKITPEYTEQFSQDKWWSELKNRRPYLFDDENDKDIMEDYEDEDKMHGSFRADAIDSSNIYWFRK